MISYRETDKDMKYSTRVAYGEALLELGEQNSQVVVLDADLMGSTKTDQFAKRFPERFFQVGIAEGDMIGVAAGLAREGFIPFASSFAIFLTGKTYDQIRQSVCYSANPVRLVATHAGLEPGPDGATHQGLEDVALMRTMPGMTVLAPADAVETRKAVYVMAAYDQPCYMRLGRSDWPVLFNEDYQFEIGRGHILREGDALTFIAYGQMVARALKAAEALSSQGHECGVLNMSTIEPLDVASLDQAASASGAVVVLEEHQLAGGLGEAIARHYTQTNPIPMGFVAMPNAFGESGPPESLMDHFGLGDERILSTALDTIKRKAQG